MSPAHCYILNNRRPLAKLPKFPCLATGPPTTLLRAAADNAFPGLHKAALIKLDKEEIGAVTVETKIGDILLVMIMKVLGLSREKAADKLAVRCLRVASCERRDMIDSEAFHEIVDEKKEVEALANALDNAETLANECCETVKQVRMESAKKAAKKPKIAEKTWPADHEITLPKLQSLQPPLAVLWYDPRLCRYQVFYGGSSISRATKLWGQSRAAKACTQWAWTMHGLLNDDTASPCPIKDLWADA